MECIKCASCQEHIAKEFPDVQYNAWLRLMHYFEHEYSEEEISQSTYELMVDSLMLIKSTLLEVREKD